MRKISLITVLLVGLSLVLVGCPKSGGDAANDEALTEAKDTTSTQAGEATSATVDESGEGD